MLRFVWAVSLVLICSLFLGCDDDPLATAQTGMIEIDQAPDFLSEAGWSLEGPQEATGTGDLALTAAPVGEYTLVWNDVEDYLTPASGVRTLAADDTLRFGGIYYLEVESGTIGIQVTPADLVGADWSLTGPVDYSGGGEATLTSVPAGEFTLTWSDIDGYVTPAPETRTLIAEGVLTFEGIYQIAEGVILTMSDNPDPISPNGIINYMIHWELDGALGADGATVKLTVPDYTQVEFCGDATQVGDEVTWELGDLNPGDQGDLSLQLRVDTPVPNGVVITNSAVFSDAAQEIIRIAESETIVVSDHLVLVSVRAPEDVQIGTAFEYIIDWAVLGDEPAPNVIISDDIPAGLAFISATGGGVQTPGTNIVTWSLGDLEPDAGGMIFLTVFAGDDSGSPYTNTVHISDDDGKTDSDFATTLVY
ncbi:MAG: DUF11 domain-containing protein [bacterium]|nr:DUF11 domain-containing protein [bacterium]